MYKNADEHRPGHVSVSEARQDFAELVNRAAYGDERIRIVRRGREIAAIVPIEDVEFLERLEDEYDIRMANEARAELEHAPAVPLEQVERELGL
jgi:prevent-host-death family protein